MVGRSLLRCLPVLPALLLCVCANSLARAQEPPGEPLSEAIAANLPKIVKVYGAGGLRGLEPYQSGIVISPEGHVLTAWSHVLDTDFVSVTLDDGRKFDARLVGADPRVEAAVLKIDATDLPYIDLAQAADAALGTRVLAFCNLFGIATGDEPASLLHGQVAARWNLDARSGAFETPYKGPVYVLDAMTNNPGSAGGLLTDFLGRPVGMLGGELRDAQQNTWLNYAVPLSQLRTSVEQIMAGQFVASSAEDATKRPDFPHDLEQLGIVLVPDVVERTPPYVDVVLPDSPAETAGLLPDDLVVFVAGKLVQSCKSLVAEVGLVDRADPLTLTIMRGQELRDFTLRAPAEESAPATEAAP
ncbi:MAG: S1C family serine protease [Pirellulales bacterium]|nr:S1C family serine protease [Pirellulales bacterium]